MNTFKKAALTVLKKAGKPLHYKEITRLALEEGLFETQGATPEATMNAQIIMDIKREKDTSAFIKTAPGTFAVNPHQKEVSLPQTPEKSEELEVKQEEEKVCIETSMIGRAGEYLVCSELLFRGFNASIMSVDTGVDIVAVKDNKIFGVQVKTSNLNQYNTYVANIRKVSFEKHSSSGVFYVFVLHGEGRNDFLILPIHEMERKVYEKSILPVGHDKIYRVNIKLRDGKVYLGNKDHEVSYFLNNWEIVK